MWDQPLAGECLAGSGFEVSLEVGGGLFARETAIPGKIPWANGFEETFPPALWTAIRFFRSEVLPW